jgi:hypothetical protein
LNRAGHHKATEILMHSTPNKSANTVTPFISVANRWIPAKVGGAAVGALLTLTLSLSPRPLDARREPTSPASSVVQSGIDVDQLVTRYLAATEEYERAFRNLTAEETRTVEMYQPSGRVEKRRQIDSDLLVYRSSRVGSDATVEYRDVRSVDGKAVERRGERALKLLTNASKADSLDKELKAIDSETRKYEFNLHLRGFTISQGGLPNPWRGTFAVQWAGREQIAGHDVVVLDYRQTAPIPSSGPPPSLPKEFGKAVPLRRGRLWLDAQTAQLWRDVWEQVVTHPAARDPLVVIHRDSAYRPSSFGILVPERIVFDWLGHFIHPKNGPPSFGLRARTTFTYGSFKRFEVATDEQMKNPEPPAR